LGFCHHDLSIKIEGRPRAGGRRARRLPSGRLLRLGLRKGDDEIGRRRRKERQAKADMTAYG
jgi:hypothetical protein